MAERSLPTPEELRQLLRYEPTTGKLFWRERTPEMFSGADAYKASKCKKWNDKFCGKEAFLTRTEKGYLVSAIRCRKYKAHRVIWAMVRGTWPRGQIDHINGDPSDNRIWNLRCVSNAENGRNQKQHASNSSGITGVRRNKKSGKPWIAEIKVDGKTVHIGTYETTDKALSARKAAERFLGFHENHGRTPCS